MKRILVLLGAPGVGKGTVGGVLSRDWRLPLISSGELLRDSIKQATALGRQVRPYVNRGELVPDELVVQLVRERIRQPDCDPGFLLDGFPRNLGQAEILEKSFSDQADQQVVYLKASDDFLVHRLADRRVCGDCGTIYHLVNIPPRQAGVCDRCGGKLIQRSDDLPAVIRKRLKVYQIQTSPLLDFYRARGILHEISGEGKLSDTVSEIKRLLGW